MARWGGNPGGRGERTGALTLPAGLFPFSQRGIFRSFDLSTPFPISFHDVVYCPVQSHRPPSLTHSPDLEPHLRTPPTPPTPTHDSLMADPTTITTSPMTTTNTTTSPQQPQQQQQRDAKRALFTAAIILGMLVTGTANTLLNKFQNRVCVENCDGQDGPDQDHQRKGFEQPIWQVRHLHRRGLGGGCDFLSPSHILCISLTHIASTVISLDHTVVYTGSAHISRIPRYPSHSLPRIHPSPKTKSFAMFVGEFLCLFVHYGAEWWQQRRAAASHTR